MQSASWKSSRWIPILASGKSFKDIPEILLELNSIRFRAWRSKFILWSRQEFMFPQIFMTWILSWVIFVRQLISRWKSKIVNFDLIEWVINRRKEKKTKRKKFKEKKKRLEPFPTTWSRVKSFVNETILLFTSRMNLAKVLRPMSSTRHEKWVTWSFDYTALLSLASISISNIEMKIKVRRRRFLLRYRTLLPHHT